MTEESTPARAPKKFLMPGPFGARTFYEGDILPPEAEKFARAAGWIGSASEDACGAAALPASPTFDEGEGRPVDDDD